jgi:tRNA U34 2-thiouridine synthase MnmA/TrmU
LNRKAIGLLSGGLDSTIAVGLMVDLGIEVIALNFTSPFCTCTSKSAGCKNQAVKVSENFNIKIKSVYMGQEYINMVANPKYGYGRNLNPCLDCRIMMFKKAKEAMMEEGASFVFTGEVLGQRPMSQRRDALNIIERDSGLKGLILRPLSAKHFDPTIPEIEGIVDRDKLLDLTGRSRKAQINLAEAMGINDYPCASGGCLLTEFNFAGRMRDLINHSDAPAVKDTKLLRVGRHFRVDENCKVIVGRDQSENEKLERLAEPDDYIFSVNNYGCPVVVMRGAVKDELIPIASQITLRYSDAPKDKEIAVNYRKKSDDTPSAIFVKAIDDESLAKIRI